ncbi:Uncharacterised protein [uncultured archaeon]|nr:Uncharacterised protein [uncultured archaeon]
MVCFYCAYPTLPFIFPSAYFTIVRKPSVQSRLFGGIEEEEKPHHPPEKKDSSKKLEHEEEGRMTKISSLYNILRDLPSPTLPLIKEKAHAKKIPEIEVVELLDAMRKEGIVYEPRQGIFKLVDE